ncbi:zinc-binding alcohol dehydrogenase [Paenibacillus sp. FSL R7-0273]|uniref:zinc-binding dehydrogenase n=1 Tax=Paenibacillus sp. FSL R7-0273 TaxID=1536772 RepID=UPI0004F862FA|nr:zinc-binding dehydrogenase [Paenibacillus sp. FSL R7-0273]AIQ48571.1 zinc-binding alcohol dehydrogenase [Paenibacillus sp. FSL R7-0273]OMF87574.1 zinc-binding alcohol dehydrogenase [Paenibacillus sp. FSL R7-0273]
MKALILEKPGELESLTVVTNREMPEPKDNEIRVKVIAAGLNPSDYQVAEHAGLESEKKRVLGLEVAGIVDAVGSSVNNFKMGDRVYYLRSINNLDGGFAEYSVTTAHTASKLPDEVPFEQAAVVPAAGYTAYQAIMQKLNPQSGGTILIHGGAGGVGGYAIQLAKICGLKVVTTCLGKDIGYVCTLGADEAIDFTKGSVYEEVSDLTNGRGVDYVLNTISPDSATKDLEILAFGGEMVVTAGFPDFSQIRFYDKGMSLHEIALGAAHTQGDFNAQSNLARIGDHFGSLIAAGTIIPPQITTITMEEIPAYLKKLKEGKITGKVAAYING